MSGGSLNYFYCDLESHVGDFDDVELDDLVKDLANLFHDREWFLSCDVCEGKWNESRDAFKAKWFTQDGRDKRINKYLALIEDKVLKSFGVSDKYCKNCIHWTKDGDDSLYGKCGISTSQCLYHRSESCDKFQRT